jgi:hypothetical protein
MPLETGTYIDSLNPSNPGNTDPLSQADDHLRLLKSTLKATFPNVAGAITGTHTAINAKVAEPVSAITSDGSVPSLNTGITGAEVKTLIGVVEPAISSDGSTPSLTAGIDAGEVRTLIGAAPAATTATLLGVYPVGAVYTAVVATNPATHFGGTWLRIGAGKVLVGIDASDTDFDTVEATGGAKTHTLTVDEIPAHTHTMTIENTQGAGSAGAENGTSSFSTVDTGSTGGGQAHTIVQPFLVVYMWKRTA